MQVNYLSYDTETTARMRASLLIYIFGLALSLAFVTARHSQPARPLPPWALNRSIAVSNFGPMSAVVNKNSTARHATLELLGYFDSVGDAMSKKVADYDHAHNALSSICNHHDNVAPGRIAVLMRMLQLGQWKSNCITELRLGNEENLWNYIATLQDTLEGQGRQLVEQTGLGTRWSQGPLNHYAFHFSSAFQTCEIRHVAAFRVRGMWAILGSLTSHPTEIRREDRGRYYLEEYLTNKNGSVGNLQLYVNNSAQVRVNATTIQSTWGGMPSASLFLDMLRLENNPAIAAAMSTGANFLAAAEDGMTAANISILVLPCFCALIPIALFLDVNWILHLYFLAADIMACLPLAFEGIELVALSATTIIESSTLVYGLDSSQDLGVAEAWVAKCSPTLKLFSFGAALLTVAFVAMTVGVVLEIYFRARLQKKDSWPGKRECIKCNYFAMRTASSSEDQEQDLLSVGILSTRLRRHRTVDLEKEFGIFRPDNDSIQPARDEV